MAEPSRPGTSPPPESAGPFASSWRRRHLTYADQSERDYAAFAAAVDSGRLAARTGV